jgi:hypothetical protein
MRLTQLTDYAMRVVIHLAVHPDRLCTIAEIAARCGISEAHPMKIAHRPGRAGWTGTVRGLPDDQVRLGRALVTGAVAVRVVWFTALVVALVRSQPRYREAKM